MKKRKRDIKIRLTVLIMFCMMGLSFVFSIFGNGNSELLTDYDVGFYSTNDDCCPGELFKLKTNNAFCFYCSPSNTLLDLIKKSKSESRSVKTKNIEKFRIPRPAKITAIQILGWFNPAFRKTFPIEDAFLV